MNGYKKTLLLLMSLSMTTLSVNAEENATPVTTPETTPVATDTENVNTGNSDLKTILQNSVANQDDKSLAQNLLSSMGLSYYTDNYVLVNEENTEIGDVVELYSYDMLSQQTEGTSDLYNSFATHVYLGNDEYSAIDTDGNPSVIHRADFEENDKVEVHRFSSTDTVSVPVNFYTNEATIVLYKNEGETDLSVTNGTDAPALVESDDNSYVVPGIAVTNNREQQNVYATISVNYRYTEDEADGSKGLVTDSVTKTATYEMQNTDSFIEGISEAILETSDSKSNDIRVISITVEISSSRSEVIRKYKSSSRYVAGNPYPGSFGTNCTYTAWQIAYDTLGIKLPGFGNAGNWYTRAMNEGFPVGSVPEANSIVVWSGGSTGLGHVAYVTEVSADGTQIYTREGSWGGSYSEGWRTNGGSGSLSLIGYIYLDDLSVSTSGEAATAVTSSASPETVVEETVIVNADEEIETGASKILVAAASEEDSLEAVETEAESEEQTIYTVSFYNEGSLVSKDSVNSGESVKKPTNPRPKETGVSYRFLGWSTDENSGVLYDFESTVESDINLYAVYSFASNNGSKTSNTVVSKETGSLTVYLYDNTGGDEALPLSNTTVGLYSKAGSLIKTLTTDSSGRVVFTGLHRTVYQVKATSLEKGYFCNMKEVNLTAMEDGANKQVNLFAKKN